MRAIRENEVQLKAETEDLRSQGLKQLHEDQAEVQVLNKRVQDLSQQISEVVRDRDGATWEVVGLQQQVKEVQGECSDLEEQLRVAVQDHTTAVQRIQELQQQLGDRQVLMQENGELKERLSDIMTDRNTMIQQRDELLQQLDDTTVDRDTVVRDSVAVMKVVENLELVLSKVQADKEELGQETKALERKLAVFGADTETLARDRDSSTEEVRRLAAELNALKGDRETQTTKYSEATEEVRRLAAELNFLKGDRETQTMKHAELEKMNDELRIKVLKITKELTQVEEAHKQANVDHQAQLDAAQWREKQNAVEVFEMETCKRAAEEAKAMTAALREQTTTLQQRLTDCAAEAAAKLQQCEKEFLRCETEKKQQLEETNQHLLQIQSQQDEVFILRQKLNLLERSKMMAATDAMTTQAQLEEYNIMKITTARCTSELGRAREEAVRGRTELRNLKSVLQTSEERWAQQVQVHESGVRKLKAGLIASQEEHMKALEQLAILETEHALVKRHIADLEEQLQDEQGGAHHRGQAPLQS